MQNLSSQSGAQAFQRDVSHWFIFLNLVISSHHSYGCYLQVLSEQSPLFLICSALELMPRTVKFALEFYVSKNNGHSQQLHLKLLNNDPHVECQRLFLQNCGLIVLAMSRLLLSPIEF